MRWLFPSPACPQLWFPEALLQGSAHHRLVLAGTVRPAVGCRYAAVPKHSSAPSLANCGTKGWHHTWALKLSVFLLAWLSWR